MNGQTKAASPGQGQKAAHSGTLSPQSIPAAAKTQARVLSGQPHKTQRSTAAQVLERLEVEAAEIESMREFHAAWLGRAAQMEVAGCGED